MSAWSAVLASALGVAMIAVAPETGPEAIRLDGLDLAELGGDLPPGWDVRSVRGSEAPTSRVVSDPAIGTVLRFDATDQAAFFGRELDTPLNAEMGTLRWLWRVERPVPSARLGGPERDDAPARLFVTFGTGGFFSPPRTIFYSWGGLNEVGESWSPEGEDRLHVIVVRNDDSPVGTWLEQERDLAADYRAAFGEDLEPVTGVGFMIDTDDTGNRAVSLLGLVEWLPREPGSLEEGP